MDTPVRKYQKQKDYQRHKLFRKMKRRRRAAIEQAKDAPMKQLRRKLKIPKFEDGKDESTQKAKRPVTTGGAGYIPDNYGQGAIDYIRKKLYDNILPWGYNDIPQRIYNAVVKNKKEEDETRDKAIRDDLFATYLQIPKNARHNIEGGKATLTDAIYKPKGAVKGKPTYRFSKLTSPAEYGILAYAGQVPGGLNIEGEDYLPIGKNRVIYPNDINAFSELEGLGQFTVGRGYDNKGEYISYYDSWDLGDTNNPYKDESLGIGRPFNIYDRIYLDDYYGVKQPTHATYLPEVTVYGKKKKGSTFNKGKDDKPNVFQLADGTFVNSHNEPLEVLDYAGVEDPTKWTYVDKKGNRYTPKAARTLTEGEQFTQRQIENEQNTRPFEFTPYIEGANEGAAAASLMMGFPFNMVGSAYYTAKASRDAYNRNYLGAALNSLGAVTPAGSGILQSVKRLLPKEKTLITAENAANITPEQWTAAQDAAIARGDMAEAQRLRDLHFKVSAPNTKVGNEVFHGSRKNIDFNSFDLRYFGQTDIGGFGYGHYFFGSPKTNNGFYGKNRRFYLNIENPYTGEHAFEFNRDMMLKDHGHQLSRSRYNEFLDRYNKYKHEFQDKDGIAKYDPPHKDDIFVVPRGEQIKSADAVTYDNSGVRIPLGKRDNFNINDIRYGIVPFLGIGGAAYGLSEYKHGKNPIHINPANRGKFNALKKRTGKTTEQLTHSKNPLTRKRAIFAQNAKKWKH